MHFNIWTVEISVAFKIIIFFLLLYMYVANSQINLFLNLYLGTYKVRNEIETKRNRNQQKRNETKRNQRNENETNESKTKSTKTKRNRLI